MVWLAYLLPAISLAGLILLLVFCSRMLGRLDDERAYDHVVARICATAAVVLTALFLQRLVVIAVVLAAALLGVLVFAAVARRRLPAASPAPVPPPIEEGEEPSLVDLSRYLKPIRDKGLSLKVKRLHDTVASIRGIAGYDRDSLDSQTADVQKMERLYLPRVERILLQYLKVTAHDNTYDPKAVGESLDAMNTSIREIYRNCLDKDKLELDVEATTIRTALDLDGFSNRK